MSHAAPLDMPRWEWRVFAPFLDELRNLRTSSPNAKSIHTHEISILCLKSMHDVLIHDGSIRLKWRKQVGPGGLELWDSVLHSPFPCPAGIVLRLFEALGLPEPTLNRPHFSRAQFIREILPQNPDLRAIDIHKHSKIFLLDGVSCEITELIADHVKVESFAIEHEDPGLALQVIRHLGLQTRVNTSYSQGLKAALNIPQQH